MSKIGLIDYDLMYTKILRQPNYELCVLSTYYRNRGDNVRLIVDLKLSNLQTYDKIYIFWEDTKGVTPSQWIKDYYMLKNIEEYGRGFAHRPVRPDIVDLVHLEPSQDVYAPLVHYLTKNPKGMRFTLKNRTLFSKYKPVKYFEEVDGELLKRQIIGPKTKYVAIYDDPLLFFANEQRYSEFEELLQLTQITFIKHLDMSKLPTWAFELIATHRKLTSLRKGMFSPPDNENLKQFFRWCENNNQRSDIRPMTLSLEMPKGMKAEEIVITGLRVAHEMNPRFNGKLKVYPKLGYQLRSKRILVRMYLQWMHYQNESFYEYVVRYTYRKELKQNMLKNKPDILSLEFLLNKYGMKWLLVELETIMYRRQNAEDLFMRGGKSYYGTERSRYSYIGGTPNKVKNPNAFVNDKRIISRRYFGANLTNRKRT